MLHRRFTIADPADPFWSRTQAAPPKVGTDGVVATISTNGPGKLFWWGIGYDGDTSQSIPVDGTGLTFDAALVYRVSRSLSSGYIYLRFSSIVEGAGAELEAGRVAVEVDLPEAIEGWIQIINVTNGSGATHLWLSSNFRKDR